MIAGGIDRYSTLEIRMEYNRACRRAWAGRIGTAIRQRSNRLYSLHDIDGQFYMVGEHYIGLMQVAVRDIEGSIARYEDFDRDFNPLHDNSRARWAQVAEAYALGITLPPVQLLKVGDKYLVDDGHHRISVARHYGVEYIDAEVTEYVTPCSLGQVAFCAEPNMLGILLERARTTTQSVFYAFWREASQILGIAL